MTAYEYWKSKTKDFTKTPSVNLIVDSLDDFAAIRSREFTEWCGKNYWEFSTNNYKWYHPSQAIRLTTDELYEQFKEQEGK